MIKKIVAIVLCVSFLACVMAFGTNRRFSLEKYVTQINEGFSEIPSINDLVAVWSADERYADNVLMLPYWERIYAPLYPELPAGIANQIIYWGEYPLALYDDGREATSDEWETRTMYLYDSLGHPLYVQYANGTVATDNRYKVITDYLVEYETYNGSTEGYGAIFEFFDNIKGFFLRIGDCLGLVFRGFKVCFGNAHLLLPWNATVEV